MLKEHLWWAKGRAALKGLWSVEEQHIKTAQLHPEITSTAPEV